MPLFQSKESSSQEENGDDEENQLTRYVPTAMFIVKSNHCFELEIQNMQWSLAQMLSKMIWIRWPRALSFSFDLNLPAPLIHPATKPLDSNV